MKNNLLKRGLCILALILMSLQTVAISVFAEGEEPLTTYNMAADIKASGEQGYNGWYYMKNVNGSYKDLEVWNNGVWSKDGQSSGNFVSKVQVNPEWECPTAVVWKAPKAGTVTLTTNERFFRVAAGNGDVTATIKLNDAVVKQNNGEDAQWIFEKTAKDSDGHNKSYSVTEIKVKKDDMIYHIADCGKNNASPGLHWQPKIIYTAVDASGSEPVPQELPVYKKADDFSAAAGMQGYNGWYYMYKTQAGEYADMTWDGSKFASGGNNVNTHFIMPGYGSPTAIVWKAQYSGTVTLKVTSNTIYRSAAHDKAGDVALKLCINDEVKWEYTLAKDATNGKGTRYTIENVRVEKGDKLYHEVDCGTNNTAADVFWKPVIEYTAIDAVQPEEPEEPKPEEPKPEEPDTEEVLPEENELVYNMSKSFPVSDSQQGIDGWYYLYYSSADKAWKEMKKLDKRFVVTDNNNNVSNFITVNGIIHPAGGSATAVGWKAPMSGRVVLTSTTPICKASAGAATSAAIIHNGNTIWSADIPGDQTKVNLGEKPEVELDIKSGEMIYFSISCTDASSAGTLWVPNVEYKQMARFSAGDKRITDITELKNGDKIECLFYDAGKTEQCTLAYLALYNENGTMVRISEPTSIAGDGGTIGRILSFDTDFTQDTYKDWELRLMLINGDGVNINPVRNPELYCIK